MPALRLGLKLLVAALLTILLLTGALWLYSGADSSLASLTRQLQRFLPAGQTLVLEGVSGSLRSGGQQLEAQAQRALQNVNPRFRCSRKRCTATP